MMGRSTNLLYFRSLHFIGFIFFSLSAYAQVNDPDPEIWITIYLLPAFLSLAATIKPLFTEHPLICRLNHMISVGYCIYGGFIVDSFYKFDKDIFQWIIHDEEGREFGGLLIISIWTMFAHGSVRNLKSVLLLTAMIILLPGLFWAYIYANKAYRLHWPEHCQTALYPDLIKAT